MTMNILLQRIWSLANTQNRNALILVCGPTGSGKSLSCIKMAQTLQPDWTLDQLCFHASDFMKLINSKKLHKGSVVIWDECGVEFDSRQFFSTINRMVSYVLESFRHRNLICFFTVPHMSMVDVNLKRLFHFFFELSGVDYKISRSIIKPFETQINYRFGGKVYNKYMRTIEDGRIKKIEVMTVGLPDKETMDKYEVKKTEFTDWLNQRAEKEIAQAEEKTEAKETKDIGSIVDTVKSDISKFTKEYGGKVIVDTHMIMAEFKIGEPKAKQVKSLVEYWLRK